MLRTTEERESLRSRGISRSYLVTKAGPVGGRVDKKKRTEIWDLRTGMRVVLVWIYVTMPPHSGSQELALLASTCTVRESSGKDLFVGAGQRV